MRNVALKFSLLLAVLAAALASADDQPAAAQPAADAPAPISFQKEVAPLLVANCLACHGPQDPKGEYQLHTFELLMKEGYSGSPIVSPGKPDESELLRLISSADADERMPKEADSLPAEHVATVRRWIEEGAKYDASDPKLPLASIVPQVAHPDPPAAYRVAVPITALAFNPQGNELAVGGYHEITIWNPVDGALLRRIKNVAERTYGLAYKPDGTLLAAASGTPGQLGEVRLFNPADGTLAKQLATMADVAFGVAFNPDGTKLAACGADRSIRVFDVASGAQEVLIEDHADWVVAIAWSADGARLASASRDKTSKVFDAKTGDSLITYPGHGEPVFGVSFNADGTQVMTAGRDKKIHVWNPADAKLIGEIAGFGHEVFRVLCQGGQIFSCSADRTVRQHAADSRSEVRVYSGHNDWVYALAYHDASKRLASGGFDGEVRVWNTADGALVTTFRAAPGYPAAVEAQAQVGSQAAK